VELGRTLCASGSPLNKSQLARALGIARSSLYVQCKRPKADKALAVRIEAAHEKDDTMGHGKLAALLGTGKNRIRRVMPTYGIAARGKRKKYVSPAKATDIAPNKLREEAFEWVKQQVVFSDILQVKLADGTRVRGCFALRHRTRQVLGIAFDYHLRADLVTDAIETMTFEMPGSIWHTDQGKQYGAGETRSLLLHKGVVLSMSRAGTPTDNGYAQRFVGLFKLAVAARRPYHWLGEFLRAAQAWINFYNQERPHQGLENLSPLQFAQQNGLEDIPSLALL
jgi:putative transposase